MPFARVREDNLSDLEFANVVRVDHAFNVCQINEHKTIEEALNSEHSKQWKEATDSEFKS